MTVLFPSSERIQNSHHPRNKQGRIHPFSTSVHDNWAAERARYAKCFYTRAWRIRFKFGATTEKIAHIFNVRSLWNSE